MADFDLDLRAVEEEIDDGDRADHRIVLGVLDGSTPDGEWLAAIERGNVLVLAVEGDVNELASGFARDITEMDGELMHFREFLIVTPPGIAIDTDRL